jgi:hypothetical protein
MEFGIIPGEHFWSLRSWRRMRPVYIYFHGGFSIGPVWFDWHDWLK